MSRLSEIEGAEVHGPGGERLGTVERVLFHPSEPRAVALMVRPDPALLVVTLPVAYLQWEGATLADDVLSVPLAKLPSRRATEKALGVDLDLTVIWRGMPVADSRSVVIGSVGDVGLSAAGAVESLDVSTGGVGDVAYGRLAAPGGSVVGFADDRVSLSIEAGGLESSGGLAAKAAETATAAKAAAATVASATGEAVVDASYIAGRAIRSAVRAKPLKKTKTAFRGIADAFREGYKGDDSGAKGGRD